MPFIDQILDTLAVENVAMHVDEIAEKMATLQSGPEELKALSNKIASTLSAHLQTINPQAKRATRNGRTKGIYRIKRARVKAPELPVPDMAELTTNYIGKAGEHAVMSELLFWGFNVSLMAVDEGIDVIATRNNKYFHIQVKTTGGRNAQGCFSFGIDRRKFERNSSADTFYILVMRDGTSTRFVVLPSNEINRLVAAGKVTGSNTLTFKIALDPSSKKHVLNGCEEIQGWINGFQFIK